MAGSFSDFLELEVLDHIFGNGSYTPPTIYVGLWTSALSDSSDGSTAGEVSGGSYVRLTTAASDWTTAAAGALANGTDLTFVEATGSWGTVTHFGLFDATTAGNMLAHADLTASKTIASGDTAKFSTGDIDVTLT